MNRYRSLTALLTVFALAFAQMAVATHSCSGNERTLTSEAPAQLAPCHGTSPEEAPGNGALCAQHCQYGKATFDNTSQVPAAVDSVGPELRIRLSAAAASADSRPAWRFVPAAAPPPPAILFGVLRI